VAGSVACAVVVSFLHPLILYGLTGKKEALRINRIRNMPGVADMRTGQVVKSRPENNLARLAIADMARFYRTLPGFGGAMQGQAKVSASFQTGVEKGMDIVTILAGSPGFGSIGGLAQPEHIISPTQMVLDDELVGLFRRFAKGFQVNEETLGFEAIRDCWREGHFLAHEHTVRHYREEIWEPELGVGPISYDEWLAAGGETDVERARKKAIAIMRDHHPDYMPADVEDAIRNVIREAETELGEGN